MKKRVILGIHGLGNKPAESLLYEWWIKSIKEGLERIDKPRRRIPLVMAYWADILYENPLNPDIMDPEDPLFLEEPYIPGDDEIPSKNEGIRTKVMRFVERNLDKIFLNKNMTLNFEKLTDRIIHNYFKDLETYFADQRVSVHDPGRSAKDEIRNRLMILLKKYKRYKIMLLSHSMGSIVAYDVLIQDGDIPAINTLVTIGSPLGLPVIVSRLYSEGKKFNSRIKKPHTPDKITHKWYNISDYNDRVALDHTLSDDYAESNKGISAEDIYVQNDYKVNEEANPHKIYGYLRTPELANIIDQFLGKEKRNYFYEGYEFLMRKTASGMSRFNKLFGDKK